MALIGQGVVAIWNDVAPEGLAEFYEWHHREHMPERVGIPGFVFDNTTTTNGMTSTEKKLAIGARGGYDLTRFLAVQLHALGSTHQTSLPGTPQDNQLLQLYQGMAEAKLTVRFGQTSIFGEGGIGAARLSSNLLATVAYNGGYLTRWRTGLTAGGGAGFDYHSLSRHFSVGLRASYFWLRDISGSRDLIATLYMRYTF